MKTNLIVQLLEISMDQLSSNCEELESPLDMICLTQHYRANPETMNTILIPVKSVNSPTLSLSRVAPRHHYEVLGNHHIFFARKKAQCPLVRCLCINRPEEQTEIWQAELQIQPSRKPNITTMNEEELQQAFAYLCKKEERILAKLLSHSDLVPKLVNDPGRPYWSSWEPFKALAKTVISGKIEKRHTDRLEEYLRCDPQPLEKLPINTASEEKLRHQIRVFLSKLEARQKVLTNLLKHEELIPKLVNDPDRIYWSSWEDFKALAKTLISSKINPKHTDRLNEVFYFDPAPGPANDEERVIP